MRERRYWVVLGAVALVAVALVTVVPRTRPPPSGSPTSASASHVVILGNCHLERGGDTKYDHAGAAAHGLSDLEYEGSIFDQDVGCGA